MFPASKIVCYYCKKAGHTLANCRKSIQNCPNQQRHPMQLVSTVSRQQVDQLMPEPESKPEQYIPVDPGFAQHCVTSTLVRPDQSQKSVSVLRDTGALQSLVSSRCLSTQDYTDVNVSFVVSLEMLSRFHWCRSRCTVPYAVARTSVD